MAVPKVLLCRGGSHVLSAGWEGKEDFQGCGVLWCWGWENSEEHEGLGWLFSASSPCFQFITSSYSIISCTNECKLTMLLLSSSFGCCSEAEHIKGMQGRDTTACKEPWEIKQSNSITSLLPQDYASSLIFGNDECLPMFSGGMLRSSQWQQQPWQPRWIKHGGWMTNVGQTLWQVGLLSPASVSPVCKRSEKYLILATGLTEIACYMKMK